MVKKNAPGYPALMGKRIGLLLQKELATNNQTGEDTERLNIFGVFDADSEFTASEVLDKKTEPEQLAKMLQALMARPVRDTRTKPKFEQSHASDPFDDDIPW